MDLQFSADAGEESIVIFPAADRELVSANLPKI